MSHMLWDDKWTGVENSQWFRQYFLGEKCLASRIGLTDKLN
jgi:hypothetical protein